MSAVVATANKLARIIYVMVKEKREFDESYMSFNEEDMLKKRLEATQKTLLKIQKQLKMVGQDRWVKLYRRKTIRGSTPNRF
ncbi:hypothetical protein EZS27_010922 [termite gut metagenome]|uniref:Uncharacterized protein n=1 Tax=termite gut metagenome TaxID=433724 RepID=A0A5J4S5A3_9ZZZZ